MRVKNTTSFLFGAKVCSRRPPRPEATLVVRGRFVLAPGKPVAPPEGLHPLPQGALTAEVFAEDDDERRGECLYPGDFADFKLRADVLLAGTCHTPGGRPLTECPVRFAVGDWSKSLRVVGPRIWVDSLAGAVPTDPLPFATMPLGWARAFGGPGHAPNPAGKGVGTRELPNLERPGEPIQSRRDRPEPAGFGPISPYWPDRAGKMGREYGKSWREERAPYQAVDFDFGYFNAAPPDQQLERFLRGDEELAFHNLHPEAPVFTARLPGRRVRVFVNDARGRFREAKMALDTLFADLDAGLLTLTWRGVEPVEEHDLTDLTAALVVDEPLAEPPRPEDGYREALLAFERDPVGLRDHVPEPVRAAWDAMQAGTPPDDAGSDDPLTAALDRRLGALAAPERARIQRAMAAMLRAPAPPGVDLRALLTKAVNDAGPAPFAPGVAPVVPLAGTLRRLLAQVAAIKKQSAAQGVDLPQIAAIEALARDPRLRAIDPSIRLPDESEAPEEEPGPGARLAGRDLTGRDLRGTDLTGADLTGAILTRADLRGAKLTGAKLVKAVLHEAILAGADLTEADLSLASLGRARAEGAIFRGAVLDRIQAAKADLRGAVLAGAKAKAPALGGADLTGADARGAVLDEAVADGAVLARADLSGARVTASRFAGAEAPGIRLDGADLARTSFAGANLAGASTAGARGEGSIWMRATLTGADFGHATLPAAHFQEARADGASFRSADLRDARFYRASLVRADLSTSNLFAADLRLCRVDQARFTGASLYRATLTGAAGAGTDFTGANLARSTLEGV